MNRAFDGGESVPSAVALLTLWEAGPSAGCATQAPETIGSSKLLGRVGGGEVELAMKYEWHILFNFACDFFFASVRFSGMVIRQAVQGTPSRFWSWFSHSDHALGVCTAAGHLVF